MLIDWNYQVRWKSIYLVKTCWAYIRRALTNKKCLKSVKRVYKAELHRWWPVLLFTEVTYTTYYQAICRLLVDQAAFSDGNLKPLSEPLFILQFSIIRQFSSSLTGANCCLLPAPGRWTVNWKWPQRPSETTVTAKYDLTSLQPIPSQDDGWIARLGLIAAVDDCWRLLVAVDGHQWPLVTVSDCWRLLTSVDSR